MPKLSLLLCIGACSAGLVLGLAWLSHRFPYGRMIAETPLLAYILIALVLSAVWVCSALLISRSAVKRFPLVVILLIGLVMRGAMFFSEPVLEDDSYRYFWDGAVTANGLDPYKYAPADSASGPQTWGDDTTQTDSGLDELRTLAASHAASHQRINYPYVSTIYPPLAQAAFAIAHVIDPFGMTGWRFVLLIADFITVWLLVLLLRAHKRDAKWVSVYWWNPVVILQAFGAGHMDLLLLPFLLAALLLTQREKYASAAIALAGAAAVKLWPALLFPLLARPLLRQPRKLVIVSGLFTATIAVGLLPQLLHALRPEAGLNAYASEWRTHAFLFSILEDGLFAGFQDPGAIARMTVALTLVLLTGGLALKYANDRNRLPLLTAIIIASLIFLSPTGYPWYLIWLAPLVAFVPHLGLLSVTALAPLYWFRFQLGDESGLYQWVIVPIAFGIPLALLSRSLTKRRPNYAFSHHHPSLE